MKSWSSPKLQQRIDRIDEFFANPENVAKIQNNQKHSQKIADYKEKNTQEFRDNFHNTLANEKFM